MALSVDAQSLSDTDSGHASHRVRRVTLVRFMATKLEGRHLVAVASPVALLGLLNMSLGITDMVMVGWFDSQGLAAIFVIGDLYSIAFNFTAGFAGLVAPYAAKAIGARVG